MSGLIEDHSEGGEGEVAAKFPTRACRASLKSVQLDNQLAQASEIPDTRVSGLIEVVKPLDVHHVNYQIPDTRVSGLIEVAGVKW